MYPLLGLDQTFEHTVRLIEPTPVHSIAAISNKVKPCSIGRELGAIDRLFIPSAIEQRFYLLAGLRMPLDHHTLLVSRDNQVRSKRDCGHGVRVCEGMSGSLSTHFARCR